MTLVEVLASLLILSVLIGALLVSRSRMLKLEAQSQQKLTAQHAAERLLQGWWLSERPIPTSASGTCGENGEYLWTTESRHTTVIPLRGLQIVRLAIHGQTNGKQVEYACVELLVHDPDAKPEEKMRP